MPSERPGPELPEVRERIAAAIHGSDYGRTCSSCLKRADAVLDVLNPPSREAISLAIHHALPTSVVLWDPVRRYGEWDVVQRDDAIEAVLRCVPVFTLSTESGDAGLTVEAAEPCAPASPVGTPVRLCGWVPNGRDPGWCSRGHGHDGPHFLHPTRERAVAAAGLTGDCSVDCLSGCAYPGEFSECEPASTKENEDAE